jgi:tetratricopeptide (TPR) repeat protein
MFQDRASNQGDKLRQLDNIEIEYPNLSAAMEWGLRCERYAEIIALCGAMYDYWRIRGRWSEGRRWYEALLEAQVNDLIRAKALIGAGGLAHFQGAAIAVHYLEEGVRIARRSGDDITLAGGLNSLGLRYYALAKYAAAESMLRKSADRYKLLQDYKCVIMALNNLANVLRDRGSPDAAKAMIEECLQICEDHGIVSERHHLLNGLGNLLVDQNDLAGGQRLLSEALELRKNMRDEANIAAALANLARIDILQMNFAEAAGKLGSALEICESIKDISKAAIIKNMQASLLQRKGADAEALRLFEESANLCRRVGDRATEAMARANCGSAALNLGDFANARTLYENACGLYRNIRNPNGIGETIGYLGLVDWGTGNYESAVTRLRESLSLLETAEGRANVTLWLALSEMTSGDYKSSHDNLVELLKMRRESALMCMVVVEAFGDLAVLSGSLNRAATLYGASEGSQSSIVRIPLHREHHERCLAVLRAKLNEPLLSASWNRGNALTFEEAIDYAVSLNDE